MRLLPRCVGVSLACLFLLLSFGSGSLRAADDDAKPEGKRVTFPTYDEVTLTGTFYSSAPAAGNKDRGAVVMLLHDFSAVKGGGRNETGLIHLAGELQKAGYSVLTFDFRGFGDSKSVTDKFWTYPNNRGLKGASKRPHPPASIDQKDFPGAYYLMLINDIAAARSYLNVLNDAGDVNSSNILVVGAGQGATLGALWMATECRRQRDNQSDRLLPGMSPQLHTLDDPEGNDLGAAVWLTIKPAIENKLLGGPLKSALIDTAKTARIPTYFLYGKNDQKAADLADNYVKAITMTKSGEKTETKNVKAKAIPGTGDLAGSMLLGAKHKTAKEVVDFLNRIIDDRGTRVRKDRQEAKYAFCWSLPWPTARNIRARPLAKLPGEPLLHIIPLNILGIN
jgi:hypothetical protein